MGLKGDKQRKNRSYKESQDEETTKGEVKQADDNRYKKGGVQTIKYITSMVMILLLRSLLVLHVTN